jgi:NAD(P)-dependent dehydrogenase (short-subunit alcohol dehydrogenase family)
MPVAIITGGTRGLGRALARDLVSDGWHIIVDARHLHDLPTGVVGIEGDVADPEHRARLIDHARSLGGLDLLVNNASALGPSPLPHLRDVPLDELEEVLRVNVVAPLGLVQLARPLLVASRGAVLNITSDASVESYEGWGAYGSSKAALDQLSNVLAAEEPGLRVWAFDPGDMRTQMHQDAFPGEDISDRPEPAASVPGLRALIAGPFPSGRYRASDVPAPLEVA